jgi:hypothetical protein
MAIAPNLGAGIVEREPKKLPIGVRAAETITTSLFILKYVYCALAKLMIFEKNLERLEYLNILIKGYLLHLITLIL